MLDHDKLLHCFDFGFSQQEKFEVGFDKYWAKVLESKHAAVAGQQ